MAHSPSVHRRLFMHPAHRTVGISGGAMAAGPYCRAERFPADGLARTPIRVILAAHASDPAARAAIASLQRAIDGDCPNFRPSENGTVPVVATNSHYDVQCRRVKLDAFDPESTDLPDADCVVAFGQGLHVFRCWSDLDPSCRGVSNPADSDDGPIEVEIATAAQWHPVLEGVGPFVSRQQGGQPPDIPPDATILLTGRSLSRLCPVAWTEHRRRNRAFYTTLRFAADSPAPDFVRLLLNAIAWVGQ